MRRFLRTAWLTCLAVGFLSTTPLFAQGWAELPNTKLQTVCPPDNFAGMNYAFSANCSAKITGNNGAVVDTKRNRLIIVGGGPNYRGNETYSLDLAGPSASTATCGGATCAITTSAGAPAMTRINDPEAWDASCNNNPGGGLQAEQSMSSIVYLPRHDKVFMWMGLPACASGANYPDKQVWWMDMTTGRWTNKGATDVKAALNGADTSSAAQTTGVSCTLDPTTDNETVLCIAGNNDLLRYDADTGIVTRLVPTGKITVQTGQTLVVDPDRKLLFAIGAQANTAASSAGRIYAIELMSGAYQMEDWTSTVKGCGDLMAQVAPSVVWDPSLHRMVGYAPRTAASSAASNQIFIFDPNMRTCVAQPMLGGSGPAAAAALLSDANGIQHGMYGRFNYVPGLNEYVLVNNASANAFAFKINANATHGLGASSLTCVDRDGDGYGTGPQAKAPPADLEILPSPLPIPNPPTATVVGTPGTATYYYFLEACSSQKGSCTLPSAPVAVTGANSKLTSANYVRLTWPAAANVGYYIVLRTTSPTPPTGSGTFQVYSNATCASGTCTSTDTTNVQWPVTVGTSAYVTSASYRFTTADIGRVLSVTGGAGFLPDIKYAIDAVDNTTGVARLRFPAGVTGSKGGVWQIPGCLGPDADDQDASVHTSADFVSKWSDIPTGMRHLGYGPANIFYLAPNGTNAGSPPLCKNNPSAPCATWAFIQSSARCGDMVILRQGDYKFRVYPPNCTAGSPFYVMEYPGERVTFTTASASGIAASNVSYVVVDGFTFIGNEPGASSITTLGSGPSNLDRSHNLAFRHMHGTANEWGIDGESTRDVTVEDSVFHDMNAAVGQHGVYFANHDGFIDGVSGVSTRPATNLFFRNLLLYSNPWSGIHLNGRNYNAIIESVISYNNGISGFSLQTGVSHSYVRNSIAMGNQGKAMDIYDYQDWCTRYDPNNTACPYDQTYNTISNFVCYGTGFDPVTGLSQQAPCIHVTNGSKSRNGDLGHQTFTNLILMNYEGTGYGPIQFNEKAYLATSKINNLLVSHTDNPANPYAVTAGTVSTGDFSRYRCSDLTAPVVANNAAATCNNADPQFVSAAPAFWNSPQSFDFRLKPTSPAVHAGTWAGAPTFDLLGNLFSAPPSLGAYEVGAASAPPPSGGTASGGTTTPASACDLDGDGVVGPLDVQAAINQVLGVAPCTTADLLKDGQCSVVDVQRVINASLGGVCRVGP